MDKKIKSILGSVLVIAIAASMMTVGTHSFFSDTETSSGNTFTAGTLDLTVHNSNTGEWVEDDAVPNVNDLWNELVNNLKPGDSGVIEVAIKNDGSIDGYADLHFKNVVNDPGTTPEPEPTPDNGELGASIHVKIEYDQDCDGNGDETVVTDQTLDDLDCQALYAQTPLLSGDTACWIITLWIPGGVGNEIQGDTVTCDLEFSLDQVLPE